MEGNLKRKSGKDINVGGVFGEKVMEVVPVRGIEVRAEFCQKIPARCL